MAKGANRKVIGRRSGIVAVGVSLAAAAALAIASPTSAADRYAKASADSAGAMRIVAADGRAIVLPKEADQVGVDRIAISSDGRSVGWVALYPNGATSYPIPLKLLIYSAGKLRTYTGNDLPVWRWHFTAGGKQIAFEQETVHGGLGIHYELHDVATGRLVAEYTPVVAWITSPSRIKSVRLGFRSSSRRNRGTQ